MTSRDRQRDTDAWTLRAGSAFLAAAALLVAVHGGAQGRAAAGASAAAGGSSADAAAPTAPRPGPADLVRRTVHLMGTRLEGRAAAAERPAALAALEAAFDAVAAEEALLSTWREDTDLARLNAAPPGAAVRVPPRLDALLAEAWAISRATGGAFDPAVGALVGAWDLRGEGRRPTSADLAAARRASGTACFELGRDEPGSEEPGSGEGGTGRAVRGGTGRAVTPRCEGAWIDAGAFGKGSALRRARSALEEAGAGAALLDFGGQLLAVGSPPGREAWPAAVAHPARRDRPLAALRLRDRSAATTSASERFVTIGGEARGHVLDPRTGRPAPAWGSVTVVAGDPLRADALSTALFVMGPREGWRWARGRDEVGVLFLELASGGDRPPGADDAPRAGGAPAAGVTACWNDAMERYLAEAPGPRRCPRDGG